MEIIEKSQLLTKSVDDLICVINCAKDYKIEAINKEKFLDILGYTNKDLIGVPILNYVHLDDIKKAMAILKSKRCSKDLNREIRFKNKKGKYTWFEIKGKSFYIDQQYKKIYLILKDITKRKKIEEELKKMEDQLTRTLELIPEIRFWKLFTPKKYDEALQTSYQLLQTVMENIPEYIFWKDQHLVYLGCNKNYAKLLGVDRPENLIAKTDVDILWNKETVNRVKELESSVLITNKPEYHRIESWILKKEKNLWFEVNRIPLHDSKRNVVGILITYNDITEQKLAEDKLKESEKKYRNMISNLDIPFYKGNLKGGLIEYNKALNEILGIEPTEDLRGLEASKFLLIPEEREKYYKDLLETGSVTNQIVHVKRPDGNIIIAQINAHLIRNNKGAPEEVEGTFIDMTEKHMTEQKLNESEERYHTLYDSSPVGIGIVELDGTVIAMNKRMEEITGFNLEDINAFTLLRTYVNPEDRKKLLNALNECDKVQNFEVMLRKKDGKPYLALLNVQLIEVDGRQVILTNCQDISSVKEMEQKLKESEKNYRLITESSHDLIVVLNYKFKFEFINEKVHEKVLGYSKDDLLGKFIADILHPDDFNTALESYTRDINTNGNQNEYRIRKKDGSYLWLEISSTIFNDHKGTKKILLIGRNIKEKKDLEKIKSDLLTRFSHEFKTPLVSIKGYVDYLLKQHRNEFSDETISLLKYVKKGSNSLENLINLFLESSKLEKKHVELNLVQENIVNIIKFSLNELDGLIKIRKHSISLDIKEELITKFDIDKIKTIISNLLTNAIKFTPPGGIISIKSNIKNNFIIISIQDNGIGLTEDERPQIFKEFGKIERYGQGWDIISDGNGMGLYISKELIELHGGKIWVESEGRNKGSTFYFSLPKEKKSNKKYL